MTFLKNVTLYRTGLILVLSAGVGMITIAPTATSAQDRSAQSQDKRQSGGQKPAAGHANKGQRPQQKARPQQQARPAQARPQQQARPQPGHNTRPATQPSRPQPNRPQPGKPQPSRPGHNNGRPTTQPNRPNHPSPGRPGTGRPNPGRPQTRPSRPQNRPNYRFRSQDTSRLRQYYRGGFGRINRRNRPHFYHGGYIPRTYWGDFQPVPYSLIGYLPAVPPGYAIGYYDGYVVVYDPTTYLILSVLDILQ